MNEATLEVDGKVMDTKTPELTAIDRCDGCGAQAYVRVINVETNKDLLFCAHHWHIAEKSGKFPEESWFLWDERSKLNQKLDASV